MGWLVHQQLIICEHVGLLVIKVLCFVSDFYLFHSMCPFFNFVFILSLVSFSHPCPLPPDKVLCHLVTRPHLQSLQHRVIWGKTFFCSGWSEEKHFSAQGDMRKSIFLLKVIWGKTFFCTGWSEGKHFSAQGDLRKNIFLLRGIWGKTFFCSGWSEEKHFSAQSDLRK